MGGLGGTWWDLGWDLVGLVGVMVGLGSGTWWNWVINLIFLKFGDRQQIAEIFHLVASQSTS